MDKVYYTVYRVTNKLSGKFYIGTHKTTNLDDGYMGSGKYLNHAINKHGIENFHKEILHVYETPEEMYAKEAEIVDEDFLAEENTYNLKIGGFGGWDYVNSTLDSDHLQSRAINGRLAANRNGANLKGSRKHKNCLETDSAYRQNWLEQVRKGRTQHTGFAGRHHTDETKAIMSEKAKQRLKDPTKNSQYGSMWITNGRHNKKIPNTEPTPDGWRRGRVLK